jgi:hypothetical protein
MITLNESENSPGKLLRKMVVAFLPNEYVLTIRLSNGAVVKGKNRAGYGGRGVFVYRDKKESSSTLRGSSNQAPYLSILVPTLESTR